MNLSCKPWIFVPLTVKQTGLLIVARGCFVCHFGMSSSITILHIVHIEEDPRSGQHDGGIYFWAAIKDWNDLHPTSASLEAAACVDSEDSEQNTPQIKKFFLADMIAPEGSYWSDNAIQLAKEQLEDRTWKAELLTIEDLTGNQGVRLFTRNNEPLSMLLERKFGVQFGTFRPAEKAGGQQRSQEKRLYLVFYGSAVASESHRQICLHSRGPTRMYRAQNIPNGLHQVVVVNATGPLEFTVRLIESDRELDAMLNAIDLRPLSPNPAPGTPCVALEGQGRRRGRILSGGTYSGRGDHLVHLVDYGKQAYFGSSDLFHLPDELLGIYPNHEVGLIGAEDLASMPGMNHLFSQVVTHVTPVLCRWLSSNPQRVHLYNAQGQSIKTILTTLYNALVILTRADYNALPSSDPSAPTLVYPPLSSDGPALVPPAPNKKQSAENSARLGFFLASGGIALLLLFAFLRLRQ